MKNIKDTLEFIEYKEIIGNIDNVQYSLVCYDSRKASEGAAFVAIKGETTDGHIYINQAHSQGTRIFFIEELPSVIKYDSCYILCKNTRITLAQLSHYFFDYPTKDMVVIGVTGTNGKTTTSYLISELLQLSGFKTGLIGTTGIYINNEFYPATHTTPESLELVEIFSKMRTAGVKYVVMEVSSHSLHQHRVNGINFKVAVFTNLSHDHLDYHKTMKEYAKAKKILFDGLDKDAFAIVNSDDEYGQVMIESTKAEILRVGNKHKDNINLIQNEHFSLTESNFDLTSGEKKYHIESPLIGTFNIQNLSYAFIACICLGISSEDLLKNTTKLNGAPGRLQRVILKNGAIGIVDYAHTPDALEKALQTCKELIHQSNNTDSKLICVFGCGGDRDTTKRKPMGEIADMLSDLVVITSDNPRTEDPELIIDEVISGIDSSKINTKIFRISDRKKAIEKAYRLSTKNDILLLAGKGHEDYQVIGKEKVHFSDIEELGRVGSGKKEVF